MGIYDETIRSILQEKEEEIALLELAFPEESKTLWKVDTVQLEKDTYVPEGESENRFDIMLSVEDMEGKKRKIYFLFEHKSYESDLVFLDLLRYVSLAYKKHLSHKNQDLGPILPILLIQTEDPWDPPGLAELLGLSGKEIESFEKFLPYLDTRIVNLHKGILEKLDLSKFFHLMLYLMHHIRDTDLEERVDYALRTGGSLLFDVSQKGVDRFYIFMNFIIKGSRHLRRDVMSQVIEKNLSEAKSQDFDTWAERERYEGKMEGRLEGKLEGKLESARLMLEFGDPVEKILKVTGLSEDQLKENGVI